MALTLCGDKIHTMTLGPQKQPNSLARIKAQTNSIRKELESIKGQRIPAGTIKYIAAIDLTPWQIEKLLEVCVSLSTRSFEWEGKIRTSSAIGVNETDIYEIMEIIEKENINAVK